MTSLRRIKTIDELQDVFGTFAEAARVLGMSPQAFHDAKSRGRLPMQRVFEQREALSKRGVDAPMLLWGFSESRTGTPEAAE